MVSGGIASALTGTLAEGTTTTNADVVKLVDTVGLGPAASAWGFESLHPHQNKSPMLGFVAGLLRKLPQPDADTADARNKVVINQRPPCSASDLGSGAARRGGSSPFTRTKIPLKYNDLHKPLTIRTGGCSGPSAGVYLGDQRGGG